MGIPTRSDPHADDGARGAERRPGRASDPGRTDAACRWDPEQWWTIGEAADLAGVAHRQLAAWIDEGRLTIRTGWREGAEIRLVRAGDVADLVPEVRACAASSRSALSERSVFTGPRRSALGAGGATQATAPGSAASALEDARAGGDAEAETQDWRVDLEREVERLRGSLDAANAARETLDAELRAARRVAANGGARSAPAATGVAYAIADDPGQAAPSRWSTAAVAAAFALLTGILAGRLAVAPPDAVAAAAPVGGASEAVADLAAQPLTDADEGADEGAVEAASGPLPATAWSLVAALAAFEPVPSRTALPLAGDSPADRTEAEPAVRRYPHRWSELAEAARAAAGVPPCAVGERMHGDLDVRRALGPCFGPATADGVAVAGSHRVSGMECCAQHAFVERVGSGVTNPSRTAALLAEAAQAERDGLVPPLLVLRAERTAADFVRACAGRWVAAGLDGGEGSGLDAPPEHTWALLGEDEHGIRLQLTSWLRLTDDGAARPFRMEIDVQGGPEGDLLREFAWLDGR